MKDDSKNNIENYILELNTIVTTLNDSNINLDDAVKLYKKGMSVAAKAQKRLYQYEQEVNIVNESESGTLTDE